MSACCGEVSTQKCISKKWQWSLSQNFFFFNGYQSKLSTPGLFHYPYQSLGFVWYIIWRKKKNISISPSLLTQKLVTGSIGNPLCIPGRVWTGFSKIFSRLTIILSQLVVTPANQPVPLLPRPLTYGSFHHTINIIALWPCCQNELCSSRLGWHCSHTVCDRADSANCNSLFVPAFMCVIFLLPGLRHCAALIQHNAELLQVLCWACSPLDLNQDFTRAQQRVIIIQNSA